jgi:aryl-alcohol dehydrogenase-like predicted oxidoreductase
MQSMAAAGAGLMGGTVSHAAWPTALPPAAQPEGEWRNKQSEMRYRRLGRTGYMVSEIVCGGNPITPSNYRHAELAIDMGLNYLDTAPAYGNGESERGYALVIEKSKRDRVFVNSKVSPLLRERNAAYTRMFEGLSANEQSAILREANEDIERRRVFAPTYFGNYYDGQFRQAEADALSDAMEKRYGSKLDRRETYVATITRSVEESLARLKTDYLDLLMCPHGATSAAEANIPEVFEAFEKLKQQGKVRFLGISSHTDPAGVLKGAVESGVYSVAMIAYSFLNREFVEPAIEEAYRRDMGVIAMKSARAVNAPNAEETKNQVIPERAALLNQLVPGDGTPHSKGYRYVLNNPHISAAISGMYDEKMVRENLAVARA